MSVLGRDPSLVCKSNFANGCGMCNYCIEQREATSGMREKITKGVRVLFSPKLEACVVKWKYSIHNCSPL